MGESEGECKWGEEHLFRHFVSSFHWWRSNGWFIYFSCLFLIWFKLFFYLPAACKSSKKLSAKACVEAKVGWLAGCFFSLSFGELENQKLNCVLAARLYLSELWCGQSCSPLLKHPSASKQREQNTCRTQCTAWTLLVHYSRKDSFFFLFLSFLFFL